MPKNTGFTNISAALAVASSALIAAPINAQEAPPSQHQWQFDTALLAYGESGDRVKALEGSIQGVRSDGDDQRLSLMLTFDALTGASATGAVPQRRAQTFTRPSGLGEYTTAAGQTPLDDTFRDTRVQINAGWAAPFGDNSGFEVGAHLSKEYDYLSLGVSGALSHSLDRNNTTLRLGLAGYADSIEPEGQIPLPLAVMPLRSDYPDEEAFIQAFNATRGAAKEHKDTAELQLGITQVINRRTLMLLNYSYAEVSGYQSDPFKLVSRIDAQGRAIAQNYESRPERRRKQALFWQTKMHFGAPVLESAYRFMHDDWGIDSHTLELRLNLMLPSGHTLEPQLRLYHQSAADFYRPYLQQETPTYASADYRLAEMTTYTLGFRYRIPLTGARSASARIAYYVQNPEGPGGPGELAGLNLYPRLEALMLQLGYRF
ncbi:DUF3570 domain-containing protein [Ferrimonas gelatinilytica]|uniref:DUF3570 domain-containing protein n=1 Tax=Ferrimonas gelatinilytica TaxID=1255257 RepID=A0ABP9RWL8_9GAMM